MYDKVMAVDFDGTLFENKWPEIGAPKSKVIQYVKDRQKQGTKIILWTCREGQMLHDAVNACANQDLYFDGINENLKERIDFFHTDPRKIGAEEYLDDRVLSVESIENPVQTWRLVKDGLPDEFKSDGSINWVFVYTDFDYMQCPKTVARFVHIDDRWYTQDGCDLDRTYGATVTHWMPLPADPKEENAQ